MDVPGFARLLKQKNPESEVWWDSSPSACASFKKTMILKYPGAADAIERLLPVDMGRGRFSVSGATTNPVLIAQEVSRVPAVWRDFVMAQPRDVHDLDIARSLYDQVIIEAARLLLPLWHSSHGAQGWLSAQVEGGERMSAPAIIARGLQLARLAPNVMIKVPGSAQGYHAIEALVAQGCSVNNTFCFTVSQAAACLKAIHAGRLRAQVDGVDLQYAQYVISFMIGRLGAEAEFERQAQQRRLCLTPSDRRWAELAVYQAIQALLRRKQVPARLLLCSLKIDTDVRGREHCWHLQRTGADTTVYTLTPAIIEFLIRRQQMEHPVNPASEWVELPQRVMNRLMAIPYFNQAYFEGDLAAADFTRHPAFITASANAREGHDRLSAFVRGCHAKEEVARPWTQMRSPMERAS